MIVQGSLLASLSSDGCCNSPGGWTRLKYELILLDEEDLQDCAVHTLFLFYYYITFVCRLEFFSVYPDRNLGVLHFTCHFLMGTISNFSPLVHFFVSHILFTGVVLGGGDVTFVENYHPFLPRKIKIRLK